MFWGDEDQEDRGEFSSSDLLINKAKNTPFRAIKTLKLVPFFAGFVPDFRRSTWPMSNILLQKIPVPIYNQL